MDIDRRQHWASTVSTKTNFKVWQKCRQINLTAGFLHLGLTWKGLMGCVWTCDKAFTDSLTLTFHMFAGRLSSKWAPWTVCSVSRLWRFQQTQDELLMSVYLSPGVVGVGGKITSWWLWGREDRARLEGFRGGWACGRGLPPRSISFYLKEGLVCISNLRQNARGTTCAPQGHRTSRHTNTSAALNPTFWDGKRNPFCMFVPFRAPSAWSQSILV